MLGNNELPEMLIKADPKSSQKCIIIQSELSAQNSFGFRELCFGVPFESLAAETVNIVRQKLHGEVVYSDCRYLDLHVVKRIGLAKGLANASINAD